MLIRHVQIRLVVSCALATKDLLEMDLIAKVWVVNNHCLSKIFSYGDEIISLVMLKRITFYLETLQKCLHLLL